MSDYPKIMTRGGEEISVGGASEEAEKRADGWCSPLDGPEAQAAPKVPSYTRADLVDVDESDMDTLGVGFYRVRGRSQRGDIYNATDDTWLRDADQELLARVDDGPTELPASSERSEIRADGKRLVMCWAAVPDSPEGPTFGPPHDQTHAKRKGVKKR